MGLTQVSTDGVKNDAITKTKIPANQIEASELADNAVDTNAIVNNAVTAEKLASGVQTTINNNADNRVITGSGTANTLEGESGLTYSSNELTVTEQITVDAPDNVTSIGGDYALRLLGGDAINDIINLRFSTGADGSLAQVSAIAEATGSYPNSSGALLLCVQSGGAVYEALRINSARNVGIGTSSPEAPFHVKHATTNAVADFESGDANVSIRFKDSATVNRPAIGATGDNLTLHTGGLERLNINGSTGRVGIGQAATGSPLHVYHSTTNESIRCKSGDEYVHIGFEDSTTTSVPYMGAQGNHLRFITGGAERLRVQSGGGISFNGDTAAANALDDYEETSWTPIVYSGIDGGASYTIQRGFAVKIGCLVHFSFFIRFGGTGNGNQLLIGGLPFTSASQPYGAGYSSSGSIGYENAQFNNTNTQQLFIGTNVNYIHFYNQGHQSSTISGSSSSQDIYASGNYRTA